MLSWLQQDLAANDKDWLIAYWHSPPYTHGTHDSDWIADSGGRMVHMRQNALPVLEQYGVDLVLCGHSHVYERSFLLNGHYGFSSTLESSMVLDAGSGQGSGSGAYRKGNSGPNPNQGTVYVVAGSSGQPGFGSLDHPAMFVSLNQMGSVVIDVNNQRLDALFLADDGWIDDRFTIIKGADSEDFRLVHFEHSAQTIATWTSIAGAEYRLVSSLSLEPAVWQPASNWILATGGITHWTNAIPNGTSPLFYRVEKR